MFNANKEKKNQHCNWHEFHTWVSAIRFCTKKCKTCQCISKSSPCTTVHAWILTLCFQQCDTLHPAHLPPFWEGCRWSWAPTECPNRLPKTICKGQTHPAASGGPLTPPPLLKKLKNKNKNKNHSLCSQPWSKEKKHKKQKQKKQNTPHNTSQRQLWETEFTTLTAEQSSRSWPLCPLPASPCAMAHKLPAFVSKKITALAHSFSPLSYHHLLYVTATLSF